MTLDFSSKSPPSNWPHGPDRYKELRRIWLWKQKWGMDDTFVQLGKGSPKTGDPGRVLKEAPAVMSGPRPKGHTELPESRSREELQKEQEEKEQQQQEAYDPEKAPLAQSITQRLRDRWAIDRTASHDQISGVAYTRARRSELLKLVGEDHYLVMEYGLRTITDLTPVEDRGGIRIDHDQSSPYQRDELDLISREDRPVESMFEALYEKGKTVDMPEFDPDKVLFVNADNTKERLTMIYGDPWTAPDGKTTIPKGAKIHEIKPGFYALCFDDKLTPQQRKVLSGNMLPGVGATPSTYQVIKEAAQLESEVPPPLTDDRLVDAELDNTKTLGSKDVAKGITTLSTLPDDHPMKTIGNASARMVKGMQEAMEKRITSVGDEIRSLEGTTDAEELERLEVLKNEMKGLKGNKLIDSALKNISRLMEAMSSYMDDVPRFSRLFDVLVDEVYLALAVAKPYDIDDYKLSAKESIERRAPTLSQMPDVQVKPFLVSSGMDTMASALVAAKTALGPRAGKIDLMAKEDNRRTRGANYFEVQFNMLGDHTIEEGTPLIMGTLNPSTPTRPMKDSAHPEWSTDSFIKGLSMMIGKTLPLKGPPPKAPTPDEPTVVVLDITVEKGGEAELDKIIREFKDEIESGALQLVLCKSYQKFPSLGSGKAMAGGVTVVGKGDFATELSKSLAKSESSENLMQNDEAQLVCHFTEHEAEMERPMLQRAAKNAGVIRGFLPDNVNASSKQNFLYAEDLPFVAIPDDKFKIGTKGQEQRPDDLLYRLGVENRFSFGFQNTSCLPFPNGVRIAAGQESEAELVEKLYSVMKIVDPARGKGPVTPKFVNKLAQDTGKDAVKDLSDAAFADTGSLDDKAARRGALLKNLKAQGIVGQEKFDALKSIDSALVEAYNDAATMMIAAKDQDASANAEWRKKTVDRLIRAGVLLETEVTRDANDVTKVFSSDKPGDVDETLTILLESLHSQVEVDVNGRKIAPDALKDIQSKIALENADDLLKPLMEAMQDPKKPVPDGCEIKGDRLTAQLGLVSRCTGARVDHSVADPEALAGAYGETATNLLAGADADSSNNAKWRKNIANRLISAGALDKAKVEWDADGNVTKVLDKTTGDDMDDALRKIVEDLHTQAEVEIDGRKISPKELREIQSKMTGRSEDDVNRLHATVSRGWDLGGTGEKEQSQNAAYLPNIVACCALTNEALFTDAAGVKAFTDLADPVIENSLDQLSPEMRQRLLNRRGEAALKGKASDPTNTGDIDAVVKDIENYVGKQPYREGGANLLTGEAVTDILNGWPPPANATEAGAQREQLDKIVGACTSGLDLSSMNELLASLVGSIGPLKTAFDENQIKIPEVQNAKKSLETRLTLARRKKREIEEGFERSSIEISGLPTQSVRQNREEVTRLGPEIGANFKTDKAKALRLKDRLARIKAGISAAEKEIEGELNKTTNLISKLEGQISEHEEQVKQLEKSTAAMKPNLRLAESVHGKLVSKLAEAKTGPKPMAPTRIGGIPMDSGPEPKRMTETDITKIEEEAGGAIVKIRELKEIIG